MLNQNTPSEEALLVEYTAANDAYMHYDSYTWQVGPVLIAGVFVFWGFLIDQKIEPNLLVVGSTLVTTLMSIWVMYSSHNRQIYLSKIHRLHEIEAILGLKQHQRWVMSGDQAYRTFGPSGHTLDALIYVIASLGTPVIGILKIGLYPWLGLPILLIVAVLLWSSHNTRALKSHLKHIPQEETAGRSL